LGASPRGSLDLVHCAQSLAAMRGRDYVLPDDIKALAPPVLAHRLILRGEGGTGGRRPDRVVSRLLEEIPVPIVTAAPVAVA